MVKKRLILYAKRDRGQYAKRPVENFPPGAIFADLRELMFEG
jgi:hypothetical protein